MIDGMINDGMINDMINEMIDDDDLDDLDDFHDRLPDVLQVDNLHVHYQTKQGAVQAVSGVSFTMQQDERFGLVGESGCGKSTLVTAFLRLTKPPGVIKEGKILVDGIDILSLSPGQMRGLRWSKISLIPQGAMNSLNPVMRIHDQITDSIRAHQSGWSRQELRIRVQELLEMVDLPARVANMYPHELSGGMKQRVCIAMATALEPSLIIADEPTSALDVVTQRTVMEMLIGVQEKLDASLILIGHDMGLEAQVVDRIAVMYAGQIAEIGTVHQVYKDPQHPYTQLLIESLPSPTEKKARRAIAGLPPALIDPPQGCLFHPRCPHVMEICKQRTPELLEVAPGHLAACHLHHPPTNAV
jgi:peptide/nickel transport system ATP-binding protein